jgi:hypothetical protein
MQNSVILGLRSSQRRERITANQRARRNRLTTDERESINTQRRSSRHQLPIDERQTMLSKRNAQAMVRRNTPCADSIAMRCPEDVPSSTTRLSISASPMDEIVASASPIVLQNIVEYYLAGEYDRISTEVDRYITRVRTK